MPFMLRDTVAFGRVWAAIHGNTGPVRSVTAFIAFIERHFGAQFVYDTSVLFSGRPEFADIEEYAKLLKNAGVMRHIWKKEHLSDEPRLHLWNVEIASTVRHVAGGISFQDERASLSSAIAEALERYIWFEKQDYFQRPCLATTAQIGKFSFIAPEEFVGFSEKQRAASAQLTLHGAATYLWAMGRSWISGSSIFIPAQTISAIAAQERVHTHKEPMIRPSITTGLATWPTREGAVLRGALELIERDAFMIMWLNRLTLPRISWDDVARTNVQLQALLDACERYGLHPELVRLITDAPAHAVCVVVRDRSANGLPITVGLKASASLDVAAYGALLEALRARNTARSSKISAIKDSGFDRVAYWAQKEKREMLSFLTAGPLVQRSSADWEHDSEHAHFRRIVSWCKEHDYEMASVDLGRSKKNPLPWHVHMVVIPELQPLHQNEKYPCFGGTRIQDVPKLFGYMSRENIFTEPHPFR